MPGADDVIDAAFGIPAKLIAAPAALAETDSNDLTRRSDGEFDHHSALEARISPFKRPVAVLNQVQYCYWTLKRLESRRLSVQ